MSCVSPFTQMVDNSGELIVIEGSITESVMRINEDPWLQVKVNGNTIFQQSFVTFPYDGGLKDPAMIRLLLQQFLKS